MDDNIKILENTKERVILQKIGRGSWFNNDCSNKNLCKQLDRPNDIIDRIQFVDYKGLADVLHVYFCTKTNKEVWHI